MTRPETAMTDTALAEAQEAAADLIVIERETALAVLTDPKRFDEFYARVKAQTATLVPDVSTQKGRDEIRSMAMKVVKTKTAIDKAGLGLTEEWRTQTATVNAARNRIKEQLDTLRDEVRGPLTEWEAADEKRKARVQTVLGHLMDAAKVSLDDTPETVEARLAEIRAIEISDEDFDEYAETARTRQASTVDILVEAHARLVREAADRAELERHRQAEAQRQEAAEAERQAEERRRADEAAEAQRVAAAEEAQRQEAARVAAAAETAAAEARAAEQRRAEEAQAERDRQHQAELAAQQQQREAAEAETRRLQEAEAEREREAAAQQQADAARAANVAHQTKVMKAAKEALMKHAGLTEEAAKQVVLAIKADLIPRVTLTF